MRSVLTISVPSEKEKFIRSRAKRMKKTLSSYFLYAIELEQQLISEEEILAMATKADAEYKRGATKELQSLKDLIR